MHQFFGGNWLFAIRNSFFVVRLFFRSFVLSFFCLAVYHETDRVDDFPEVMGRYLRCHTDRDTVSAHEEQIRNCRGKQGRFLQGAVEIVNEFDRFFVDITEHFGCDTRHFHFGIAHGGGRIAVYGSEVSLSLDERVAHGEVLRHTGKRVIYRHIAVRMVFSEHFADYFCRFAEPRAIR